MEIWPVERALVSSEVRPAMAAEVMAVMLAAARLAALAPRPPIWTELRAARTLVVRAPRAAEV